MAFTFSLLGEAGTCQYLPPKLVILLLTLLLTQFHAARGHGRLLDPPSRASMWRLGFDSPADYDDHQGYCGGKSALWNRFGGECGVCGDPIYPLPRPHERGGRYYSGTPTRVYQSGDSITITMGITANHRGWVEFRVCPYDDPEPGDVELDEDGQFVEVTQDCLDRYLLELEDGQTRFYLPEPYSTGDYSVTAQLPPGLECEQCLFQWKWNVGNSWGTDPDGTSCVGCGEQEQFYACADIVIESSESSEESLRPRAGRPRHRPNRRRSRGHKGKGHRHRNPEGEDRRQNRRNNRRNKQRETRRGKGNSGRHHQTWTRASTVPTSTPAPAATTHREVRNSGHGLDQLPTSNQVSQNGETEQRTQGGSFFEDSVNDQESSISKFWWLLQHIPLSPHVSDDSNRSGHVADKTDTISGQGKTIQDKKGRVKGYESDGLTQDYPGFWNWLKTKHLKIPEDNEPVHESKMDRVQISKEDESQDVKSGATWYDRLASKLHSTTLGRILSRSVRSVHPTDIKNNSHQEGYAGELDRANPKLLAKHLNSVGLTSRFHKDKPLHTPTVAIKETPSVNQFDKGLSFPSTLSQALRLNTETGSKTPQTENLTVSEHQRLDLVENHQENLHVKHEKLGRLKPAGLSRSPLQDVAHPTVLQRDMEDAWRSLRYNPESVGHQNNKISSKNGRISHSAQEHAKSNKITPGSKTRRVFDLLGFLSNILQRRLGFLAGDKSFPPKRNHTNDSHNLSTFLNHAGENNSNPKINFFADVQPTNRHNNKTVLQELGQAGEILPGFKKTKSKSEYLPISKNIETEGSIKLHYRFPSQSNTGTNIRQINDSKLRNDKAYRQSTLSNPSVNPIHAKSTLNQKIQTVQNVKENPLRYTPEIATENTFKKSDGRSNKIHDTTGMEKPLLSSNRPRNLRKESKSNGNSQINIRKRPTDSVRTSSIVSPQHSVSMARNELPLYDHADLHSSQTYSHGHHRHGGSDHEDHEDHHGSEEYHEDYEAEAHEHEDYHEEYHEHDEDEHEHDEDEHEHDEDEHEGHEDEEGHEEDDHEEEGDEHDEDEEKHEDHGHEEEDEHDEDEDGDEHEEHEEHDHEDLHKEEEEHDDHEEEDEHEEEEDEHDEEEDEHEHEHEEHEEHDHEDEDEHDYHEDEDEHEEHEEHDHEDFHEEEDEHDEEDEHEDHEEEDEHEEEDDEHDEEEDEHEHEHEEHEEHDHEDEDEHDEEDEHEDHEEEDEHEDHEEEDEHEHEEHEKHDHEDLHEEEDEHDDHEDEDEHDEEEDEHDEEEDEHDEDEHEHEEHEEHDHEDLHEEEEEHDEEDEHENHEEEDEHDEDEVEHDEEEEHDDHEDEQEEHEEHDHEDFHEEEEEHDDHEEEDEHEDHEDEEEEHDDHEDEHEEHEEHDHEDSHEEEEEHDDHEEEEEEHDDHEEEEEEHDDHEEEEEEHDDHEDEHDEDEHDEDEHEEHEEHDHEDFHEEEEDEHDEEEDEHEHEEHEDEHEHDEEEEHDDHEDEHEEHEEHDHEDFHEHEDEHDDEEEEHDDHKEEDEEDEDHSEHDHEDLHEYEDEHDEDSEHDNYDDDDKHNDRENEDDEDHASEHDDEYDDEDGYDSHEDDDDDYHEVHHQHDEVDPHAWVFHKSKTHTQGDHEDIILSDTDGVINSKSAISSAMKQSNSKVSKISDYTSHDCDDKHYGVHGDDDEYHGYDSHEYDHECGSYNEDSSYDDDDHDEEEGYEDKEHSSSDDHHEHHGDDVSHNHGHSAPEFPPFPSLGDDDYKYEYTYEYDAKGGYDYSPYYPEKEKSSGWKPSTGISKGASHQTKAKVTDKEPVIICREDSHSTRGSYEKEQLGKLTFNLGKERFYVIPVSAKPIYSHTGSKVALLTELPQKVVSDISEKLVDKRCKTALWPLSATTTDKEGSESATTSNKAKIVDSNLHVSSLKGRLCQGSGVWAHLEGMSEWCQQNCERDYCPASHCHCV